MTFGYICQLSRDTPISQALYLSIGAFTSTPPATDWKLQPDRPCRTWLQQEEKHMGLPGRHLVRWWPRVGMLKHTHM